MLFMGLGSRHECRRSRLKGFHVQISFVFVFCLVLFFFFFEKLPYSKVMINVYQKGEKMRGHHVRS